MRTSNVGWLLTAGTAVMVLACGDSTAVDDHTPIGYTILVNGIQTQVFPANRSSLVQIRFRNAAQQVLDDLEPTHFAALSFTPTSLATVARVPGHNFQFEVTGGPVAEGTAVIGFGHDEQADEVVFDPVGVAFTADP